MSATFGAHAWALPADRFAEAWNGAASFDEAATAIRGVASGPTPRWALLARVAELRREGLDLRLHTPNTAPLGVSSALA